MIATFVFCNFTFVIMFLFVFCVVEPGSYQRQILTMAGQYGKKKLSMVIFFLLIHLW